MIVIFKDGDESGRGMCKKLLVYVFVKISNWVKIVVIDLLKDF